MNDEYGKRRVALKEKLRQAGLSAALVSTPGTLLYLTGFRSDPMERFLGLWIPTEEAPEAFDASDATTLFAPELDAGKAAAMASGVGRIVPLGDADDPFERLGALCGHPPPARCGVEKNALSWLRAERIQALWPTTAFKDIGPVLHSLRRRKSAAEAELAGIAARMAGEALQAALASFRRGMTERELAGEIDRQLRLAGAEGPAFATTVLAGARSALPHGETGDAPIREGDLLLIDMGARYGGYLSDMTRTFVVGEGTEEQAFLYETVKEANRLATEAVKEGVPLRDVDEAARSWIESRGCGPLFTHRVGHGLGLDIHEEPSVHGRNNNPVERGMLFTIEPGVYKEGVGGVRIEDDVYVDENGAVKVLTTFPRELIRL